MSTRRLFLTQLGLSVASLAVLPAAAEVEKVLSEKLEGDPFWHIRELMKAQAKEDWEYHFVLTGNVFICRTAEYQFINIYTVLLLQNGNIHRESWYADPASNVFDKRDQESIFRRLMHGVEQFNSLPIEKQQEIRDLMENHRRYRL